MCYVFHLWRMICLRQIGEPDRSTQETTAFACLPDFTQCPKGWHKEGLSFALHFDLHCRAHSIARCFVRCQRCLFRLHGC